MNISTGFTYDYIINQLPNQISIEEFQNYLSNEYIKQLNKITNLTQIETKSIEELCPVLNYLISRNIYYINSGKILLYINPGPSYVNDIYFNLKEWYESVSIIPFNKWSPHIYSTAHSCFAQMIEENKDQAIVLTGPIGSGKSYNANKLIQYLFFISSPSNFNKETYEVINKGMKLMNIVNSIYQKNNLNSSSSGIVYHIGFTPSNEIGFFDIDSEILDCTLPFSENGRSFTLLHGFALTHPELLLSKLKKKQFNFFNKYYSSFSKEKISSLNKKDVETWETFKDHCNAFLTQNEFKDVLLGLELILLLNEITLLKTKAIVNNVRTEVLAISKSKVTQRIAAMLNVTEQKLIELLQSNALMNQQKTLLVSIMKYSYCCLHDFILKKIKYKFSQILDSKGTKYIHIVDFSGQVNQHTLGGMTLNFANECLNLYSMSNYTSVLSQLETQKIRLKTFDVPLAYKIIKFLIGDKGLFRYLSNNNWKSNSLKDINALKMGNDNINKSVFELNLKENTVKINYSYANVTYNYNDLHMETYTLIVPHAILKLLMNSQICLYSINPISKTTPISIPIHEYAINKMRYLLYGLESIEPFVVHCLHSNNSYLDFFNNNTVQMISDAKEEEIFMTRDLLFNNITNNLIIPVLHWGWNGYEEWINLKTFSDDFADNYNKILEYIKSKKDSKLLSQDQANINNQQISNEELCKSVISLFSIEKECLIGTEYLLMKKNGYHSLKRAFDNLLASIIKSRDESFSKNASKPPMKRNPNKDSTTMNKSKQISLKASEQKSLITSKINISNNNNSDQSNQLNKLMTINFIDQSGSTNNDMWLDNKYNIENIFQKKSFNETNADLNQFKTVGKLYDINSQNNDINAFIPFIILIQSRFRGFIIRKTFTRLYRYIKHNSVIIQSYFRGYLLRIRFCKFIDCLKDIILIQICYKVRYDKKTEASIKLQRQWRRHLKSMVANKNNKKNKNIISISASGSISNNNRFKNAQLTKSQSKQLAKQLENETDKDKIIDSILHNSFLSNETKYSHYGLYKSIQNCNRKSSQLVYGVDGKLEDRLIQYGRNLRLRQLKNVSKQMELDYKEYTFKPKLNENRKIINSNNMTSFYERCEYYEKKRRYNLEKLKERIPDEVKAKCTFKPQINDIGLKRDYNDLLLWNEKVNKEKEEYRKHYKEHNKENEFNCQIIYSLNDKIDFSNDNVLRHYQKKFKNIKNEQSNKQNKEEINNGNKDKNQFDNNSNKNNAIDNEEEDDIFKNEESSSIRDVWPIELQKDYILDDSDKEGRK